MWQSNIARMKNVVQIPSKFEPAYLVQHANISFNELSTGILQELLLILAVSYLQADSQVCFAACKCPIQHRVCVTSVESRHLGG